MKSKIREIVKRQNVYKIKKTIEKIDIMLVRFFSKTGWLSSLYYLIFSNKFHREHRSVLLGRLSHWNDNQLGRGVVTLRRNIHRLEKGLIMQPRREIFALQYIFETVTCYNDCVKSNILNPDENKWASDVLSEYFKVSGENEIINRAHKLFMSISKEISPDEEHIPYPRTDVIKNKVSYDDLYSLFKQRRSVRWYLDKEVDSVTIAKAVDAASLAPSACNRQPYKFVVISEKNKVQEIADFAMGTVGFSHNLPCIIAIVGDLSAYSYERDRHVIYIDASLASMQLMLALETLGMSTCPINWPDIESRERKLESKLNLESYERTVMLLAVGYAEPTGLIPYSQKKSATEIIKVI
ncbi:nitroreductase family protein [Vibrio cyclitrophicus]